MNEAQSSAAYMECSVCRVPLQERLLASQLVDECPQCGGTFFDAEELREVTRLLTVANSGQAAVGIWRQEDQTARQCPRCLVEMIGSQYGYDSHVPIQKCSSCHGVWLEPGRIQDIVTYKWGSERSRRWEQAYRADHEANQQMAENRLTHVLRSPRYALWVSGVLSLLFAIRSGLQGVISYLPLVIMGICAIRFCDFLQHVKTWRVQRETPALMVAVGGWILILIPIGIWIISGTWPEQIHFGMHR